MSTAAKTKKSEKSRGRGRPALGSRAERAQGRRRLLVAKDRFPITEFLSYREYLLKIYEFLKAESPAYSYGQLAEDLGFSRSNVVWLFITGRRRISPSACQRLVEALGFEGTAKRYMENLRLYNNARRTDEREAIFLTLMELKTKATSTEDGQRALEYFSEWYYPLIREMIALEDFRSEVDWINQRLVAPLMPMQIHKSLELLERLGLIVYDRRQGRHVQTGGQVLPDRSVERIASVRFHQRMCDMAREAVTRVSASRREMNTMTIRVSDDVAMKASEILYRACEQLIKLESESKAGNQIYQVNVHLFPLTKSPGSKGE